MTDRRALRWATTTARVVVGTAVAAGVVVGVSVGIHAPWPVAERTPLSVEAVPAPSDTVAACTGPLLALGRVVEQADDVSVAAPQQVVTGPAGAGEVVALTAAGGGDPVAFIAPPEDRTPSPLAAAGSAQVDAADLRGFAASACRAPLLESWIVGGTTTTGSSDLVALANPGDVAADVEITVYGADGGQVAPGGASIVVPARTQVVVPLAGIGPGQESPVLRITATGSPVAASLQSSLLRTLDPGGVDQVGAVPAASDLQVIPGVAVATPAADESTTDAPTTVRMLSPTADTSATVTVRDSGGVRVGESTVVPLAAGVPSELGLPALAAGRYSVEVSAGAPIVAGAWSTTGFAVGADFGWFASAPEVAVPTVLAVPDGPDPVLTIANPSAADATVGIDATADGGPATVTVRAGGVAEVPLAPGGVLTLTPDAPVHAAVSYSGAGALAGYAVWAADEASGPVVVYP